MGELENGSGLGGGVMGGGWMWDGEALSVSPPVGTSGFLASGPLLRAQSVLMLWSREVRCKHPQTPRR